MCLGKILFVLLSTLEVRFEITFSEKQMSIKFLLFCRV